MELMDLIRLAGAVIVLGLVIFIHELGHFLFAKLNGVCVLEFAIGFGKKIWKKRIGETLYSLRMFPLGGFVKMSGDDPGILEKFSDKSEDELREFAKEEGLNQQELKALLDKKRWFLNKPYFAKIIIVLAGPGFNLLSALVLSFLSLMIFGASVGSELPIVGRIMEEKPAYRAGIREGDLIKSIDSKEIKKFAEIIDVVETSQGKELQIQVERKDSSGKVELLSFNAKPEIDDFLRDAIGNDSSRKPYKLGIMNYQGERESVTLEQALYGAPEHVIRLSLGTLLMLKGLITGQLSSDQIGGPVMIFYEAKRSIDRGIADLFDFIIIISVTLAVMNLLPIPVLDGGHILFFTITRLRGRPLSLKIQEFANTFGMLVLLLLMVFAFSNDVRRYSSRVYEYFRSPAP